MDVCGTRAMNPSKDTARPHICDDHFDLEPCYDMEKTRLETFNSWPLPWISVFELAKTGFYYLNEGDKVRCHYCAVVIYNWEATDVPKDVHKKLSPDCPMLNGMSIRNVKLGKEDIVERTRKIMELLPQETERWKYRLSQYLSKYSNEKGVEEEL